MVAAALTLNCALRKSYDAKVTVGAGFANIVKLPREPAQSGRFDWDSRFDFRLDPTDSNAVFVRAYAKDDSGAYHYSDDAWALQCAGQVRVREASDQAWTRAAPLRQLDRFARQPGNEFQHPGKGRNVNFLVSPGNRRIAVLSFDRDPSAEFFRVPEPFSYLLEIYDAASGRLLSSAEGYVNNFDIHQRDLAAELSWITDRFFYTPMSSAHDKLLFFDLGGVSQ